MLNRFNLAYAALLVLAGVGTSSAAETTMPLQCAARDVQVLMTIEQQGDAQAIPGDQVAAAFLALLDARQTCLREGAGAGLARYEAAIPTSEMARK